MFCWIKSYKIFFFLFSQKKELLIWRKGKLSKNCPKIVKIDKVYKVTLHSFIIFNIFVFYCFFFYFLTFLLINLGSKKGPYFWWAITQKRGKTYIFLFFYMKVQVKWKVLCDHRKNSNRSNIAQFWPKDTPIFQVFGPLKTHGWVKPYFFFLGQ